MKRRLAEADIEAAYLLGVNRPSKRLAWAVRVAGEKARARMKVMGSVRGMVCRAAYGRGKRHGEFMRAKRQEVEAQPCQTT